jgi:hypothetical protein
MVKRCFAAFSNVAMVVRRHGSVLFARAHAMLRQLKLGAQNSLCSIVPQLTNESPLLLVSPYRNGDDYRHSYETKKSRKEIYHRQPEES